jgi:hypothetical protein
MSTPPTAKTTADKDAGTGQALAWTSARPRLWFAVQLAIIAALTLSLITLRFAAAQHRLPEGLAELTRWTFQGL